MPMTHSGVAYGHTINLGGDVYGATVNLAARLRSVARPGAIALAREQAQVMEDRPDLVLRKIRRTYDFKGIGRTRISTVSRNPEYVAEAEAEAVEREVEPTREEPPSTG
jgi:adenylate cyclase